ncbi:hypothetical protein CBM2634_B170194 [Cupriavidus taiwanensis]|uniref:Uncharacterized protein n=1 Tax=Cupriavidus taiwanensis TaxID=164546 RepID=A0A375J6Y1_9BURK|nr:hypothetical protein CBM2634_B170194 [Cupriavidus taiwanensis]
MARVQDAPGAPALQSKRGEVELGGLSLTVRPGERIGLVGRSGAGLWRHQRRLPG